jgi:hypothetical protein
MNQEILRLAIELKLIHFSGNLSLIFSLFLYKLWFVGWLEIFDEIT